MTSPISPRPIDYLEAARRGKQILAETTRERSATPGRFTVAARSRRPGRWRSGWIALALALAACGGGHHGDTYAKATDAEAQCCEHLAGPARDQCLQNIVRVEDPAVAKTKINQQQFACVQENFACDPKTGHATQASAQAQMDCIQDLD